MNQSMLMTHTQVTVSVSRQRHSTHISLTAVTETVSMTHFLHVTTDHN